MQLQETSLLYNKKLKNGDNRVYNLKGNYKIKRMNMKEIKLYG